MAVQPKTMSPNLVSYCHFSDISVQIFPNYKEEDVATASKQEISRRNL